MKTMTKRDLSRNASKITTIKPGESVEITDRKGRLTLTREKRVTITPDEMEAEVDRIGAGCPAIDTLVFLREGEQ